ncbi:MAG: hypothetical protein H7Y61_17285, partial [Rhizobiales bacterium]|nr:hypothetical protein [Rhizobacter sp.]
MPTSLPSSRLRFAIALLPFASTDACAGLSLDEALQRHRALLGSVQSSRNVPTAATTTSTAAAAFTPFTGCAIGALFLAVGVRTALGLAAGL